MESVLSSSFGNIFKLMYLTIVMAHLGDHFPIKEMKIEEEKNVKTEQYQPRPRGDSKKRMKGVLEGTK